MELTSLKLYKSIPFQRDYKHTIDFNNISEQKSYFNSIFKKDGSKQVNNFLYIDDNRKIIVEGSKGEYINYNYLSYVNGDNSKTYYAFIDKIQYVSEDSTEINFTIDLMQTYMFDYTLDECYIDRMHINRFKPSGQFDFDNKYLKISEEIMVKDYESTYRKKFSNTHNSNFTDIFFIIITLSESILETQPEYVNHTPNLYTYVFPISKDKYTVYDNENKTKYPETLAVLSKTSFSPKIISCVLACDIPVGYTFESRNTTEHSISFNCPSRKVNFTYNNNNYCLIDLTQTPITGNKNLGNINIYNTISAGKDFNPNNLNNIYNEIKLWCYPYSKIVINNGNTKAELQIEDCDEILILYAYPTATINSKYILAIKGYKDNFTGEELYQYPINFYENLTLPYSVDSLQQYLINNTIRGFSSQFTSIIDAPGKITGVVNPVVNIIESDNSPDKAYNIKNDGSNYMSIYNNETQLYIYQTKLKQFVFNLFTKKGYKINNYEKPNIKSRYWFNYIKTYECNITSINIGENDIIEKIKEIYNSGITFWHYNSGNYKFKNYEDNNIERSVANV